jgi:hypothetical protein
VSLALTCKTAYSHIYLSGPQFWQRLVKSKYDPVRQQSPEIDWRLVYQCRVFVENILSSGYFARLSRGINMTKCMGAEDWRECELSYLEVALDMMIENGIARYASFNT